MVRQYGIRDGLRAEAASPHLGRHAGIPLELAVVEAPHGVSTHVQGLAACGDIIAFGPFQLRAAERLLKKGGVQIKLGSRALDILIALVDRAPGIVSKRELLARVWPDLIVDEGSLRFHIAALRKVLGKGESGCRYVTNIAGRGYCFAAPVFRAGDTAVMGDPTQIHWAVMNLCMNAIQAMKAGGALTVSLDLLTLADSRAFATATLSAGEYIRLLVRDSGIGIEPDVLERIFEPFFTTKEPGAGTGLGLAVVQGIVNDLGGAVDVESEPGRGSVFTVLLPRSTSVRCSS
jgi:signal transduction histidine kinase